MDDPQPQDITFRSKVGAWLIVAMAVPLVAAWFAFSLTKRPGTVVLASCLPVCGVEGLFVWMLIKTRYRLSCDRVWIESSDFEINLAISDILTVTPSQELTSSPALSRDRIKLEYLHQGRKASVLISPKNRDLLVKEIQRRDSGLKPVQDRLVRDPLVRSPD